MLTDWLQRRYTVAVVVRRKCEMLMVGVGMGVGKSWVSVTNRPWLSKQVRGPFDFIKNIWRMNGENCAGLVKR